MITEKYILSYPYTIRSGVYLFAECNKEPWDVPDAIRLPACTQCLGCPYCGTESADEIDSRRETGGWSWRKHSCGTESAIRIIGGVALILGISKPSDACICNTLAAIDEEII